MNTEYDEDDIERCIWELVGLLYDLHVITMHYSHSDVMKFIRKFRRSLL